MPLLLHQQTNVSPQISSGPLIANYLAAEAAAEQSFMGTAHNVQGLFKRQQITKKEQELSQQSGMFPQSNTVYTEHIALIETPVFDENLNDWT